MLVKIACVYTCVCMCMHELYFIQRERYHLYIKLVICNKVHNTTAVVLCTLSQMNQLVSSIVYFVADGTDLEMKPLTQTDNGNQADQNDSIGHDNEGYSELRHCTMELYYITERLAVD